MTAIFFDLDGTLTDPKAGITRSIKFALERLGMSSPPESDLEWCIGPPLLDSFEQLLGGRGKAKEALKLYRERFTEIGIFENRLYDGISAGLSKLSASGRPLFVATSKPKVFADRIISHFEIDGSISYVFGSELDGTHSDKSELLQYALRNTGVDASEAIMVGDRRHDIKGALDNGMHAIGVLYGYGSHRELKGAGAHRIYETPEAVMQALARQS